MQKLFVGWPVEEILSFVISRFLKIDKENMYALYNLARQSKIEVCTGPFFQARPGPIS
jgi:hypothetical protein